MLIIFRTDSSRRIATGHIQRCISIANYLRKSKHKIIFITQNNQNNSIDIIKKNRFRLFTIKSNLKNNSFDWKIDSKKTINVIKKINKNVHWLIVDQYNIDYKWENKLNKHVKKILLIDGPAKLKHKVYAVLNPNYLPNIKNIYNKKMLNKTKLLLGPKYSIISSEFIKTKKNQNIKRDEKKFNILVFYGGVDMSGETMKFLKAVNKFTKLEVFFDIVIGKHNKDMIKIKKIIKKIKNINLHIQTNKMPRLMKKAHVSFGAGGVTTWERIYMNLPSFITSTVNHQDFSMKSLEKTKSVEYLGKSKNVSSNKIYKILNKIINKDLNIRKYSYYGKKMIDGEGLDRIKLFLERNI